MYWEDTVDHRRQFKLFYQMHSGLLKYSIYVGNVTCCKENQLIKTTNKYQYAFHFNVLLLLET